MRVISGMYMGAICNFIRACEFDPNTFAANLKVSTYGNREKNDPDIPGEESTNIEKEFYFRAPGAIERLLTALSTLKERVWFREVRLWPRDCEIVVGISSFKIFFRHQTPPEEVMALVSKALACEPHSIEIKNGRK